MANYVEGKSIAAKSTANKNYFNTNIDRLKFRGQRIIDEIAKIKEKRHFLEGLDWTDDRFRGYELLMTPQNHMDLQQGTELIMGTPAAQQMFRHLGMEWI